MMPLAPIAHPVVEGEPGIFPDPVARVMRAIGGFLSRKRSAPQEPAPPEESTPPADHEPPQDGQADEGAGGSA